jgi:Ca2+-dependent lipid-binding protein
MDWAISFTPSDIMDITKRQALAQVNPKIVLSIRLGKGFVSKALPILLEDINFTGRMRCARFHIDRQHRTDVSGSSYSS